MKLFFLGSAQDAGVPQIGCSCHNCLTINRTAASIALIEGNDVIIIDITPDFRLQYRNLADKFKARLSAIYLTHAHWGHYGGLMLLGKEGPDLRDMPVWLSQSFLDFLSSNSPFSSLFKEGNLVPHIIEENVETVHGMTPISVKHRDEFSDTFGFIFNLNGKRVLYLPDADRFDDNLQSVIRSVDLAIIDGTFFDDSDLLEREIGQVLHPFVKDSMNDFADIAGRIIFTHLNHSNPLLNPESNELLELRSKGFRIADDGLVIG